MGLCEIPWVRESQSSAQEIDHVDVVLGVLKPLGRRLVGRVLLLMLSNIALEMFDSTK